VSGSKPTSRRKVAIWIAAVAVAAAVTVVLALRARKWRPRSITIQGAVIRRDADPRKESPIPGAVVTAFDGQTTASTNSGDSGYFKLALHERVWPVGAVTVSVRHPDYHPLDLHLELGLRSNLKKLYIAKLDPIESQPPQPPGRRLSVVSNIRVRYTVNIETQVNVGTAVKTFEIVNQGNIPCRRRYPCSPDGSWKASSGSITLDAGPGNEFRNVRASCIAGPCPFTSIDSSGFTHGGRTITASALDWSGTATFLVEAEVFQNQVGSSVRESYPVIYGRTLHFSLPSSQEGVSLEAEIDGAPMVFPLGPGLYMSWADCSSASGAQDSQSTAYQCELKPGYRF